MSAKTPRGRPTRKASRESLPDRETAQRHAAYRANLSGELHGVVLTLPVGARSDDETSYGYVVRKMSDELRLGRGLECIEQFGPVEPSGLNSPGDLPGAPDSTAYVYRSCSLDDALANYTARHRRGQAVYVAGAPLTGEIEHEWLYVVVPAHRWDSLLESMVAGGHSKYGLPVVLECAGTSMPALKPEPSAEELRREQHTMRGATTHDGLIADLDELLNALGLTVSVRFCFPQEPGTSTTHCAMGLPTMKAVDQLLLFVTSIGGFSLERVKAWSFELVEAMADGTEYDGMGPGSSLECIVFIPIADIIAVRAALRAAAERMHEVLAVGRSWRTTEECLSNAMAGGKSYGHADMPLA